MIRIPRSWQGLSLLLGIALSLPLISGQGCLPPPQGESDTSLENTPGLPSVQGDPNALVTTPLVQILFPNGGEQVESGTIVAIRVFARHSSIPDPTLRVFYDTDNNSANGNTTISTIKTSAGGTGWNTLGIAQGQYYVGTEMVGITPAVIDYSDAAFDIVPAGTADDGDDDDDDGGGGGVPPPTAVQLAITAPRNNVNLFEGATYNIQWSTNVQPSEATARVFRDTDLNKNGIPDGLDEDEFGVLNGEKYRDTIGSPGIEAALQKLSFNTTGVIGTFFIGVTVTPRDGRDSVTAYSTGKLNISAPVFWVGDLATKRDKNNQVIIQPGPFIGAVLKGANFQDNLGSAMIAADDFDSDGNNDIVLAAQFGKPFFFTDQGRGAGEAYLIYGSATRMSGDISVNNTGQETLPGVLFTGVLPNPHGNQDIGGNKFAFKPDPPYLPTTGYDTEGLRSLTVIPDQDGDGKQELVFGFPWCDSYSLEHIIDDGLHPAPVGSEGFLENDGHFLRGGAIVVSSRNSLISSRAAVSRHYDRTLMLQEAGQLFANIFNPYDGAYEDLCPNINLGSVVSEELDTVRYPFDGFWQITRSGSGRRVDPPRLADPRPAGLLAIAPDCGMTYIDINQVDPPPIPTSTAYIYGRISNYESTSASYCDLEKQTFPFDYLGSMPILGTGFWVDNNSDNPRFQRQQFSQPREPYGCRILGQTTTQLNTSPTTTANRFGASISTSGDFLVVGAPMRTALQRDVVQLPDNDRYESGEVYMLQLRRPGTPTNDVPWRYQASEVLNRADMDKDLCPKPKEPPNYSPHIPQPHNYIIDDVGYTRHLDDEWGHCLTSANGPDCGWLMATYPGAINYEMNHPTRIVGAAAGDRIGESVSGVYDINLDGVDDVAIGGPGTNTGKGAVYIIYRRQPEIEGDYLLERLQVGPSDPNRLDGLMIVGEQGEELGSSIAGPGPATVKNFQNANVTLKDDFNDDSSSDVLIGSPNAVTSNGFESGRAFILFGGNILPNPQGGYTIAQLVTNGDGMLLLGAEAGDRAGEIVSSAGDVNGDGVADFLISAPKATVPNIQYLKPGTGDAPVYQSLRVAMTYDSNGDGIVDTAGIGIDRDGDGKADALNPNDLLDTDGNIIYTAADDLTDAGVVYLVFGGTHLKGVISLSEIGTSTLPGMVFVGRAAGYELGGGHTQNGLLARGLSFASDLDGDGYGDLMLSSVLADPDGKTNAGEVYVIYGFAP